jgi:hypothetical protein
MAQGGDKPVDRLTQASQAGARIERRDASRDARPAPPVADEPAVRFSVKALVQNFVRGRGSVVRRSGQQCE